MTNNQKQSPQPNPQQSRNLQIDCFSKGTMNLLKSKINANT